MVFSISSSSDNSADWIPSNIAPRIAISWIGQSFLHVNYLTFWVSLICVDSCWEFEWHSAISERHSAALQDVMHHKLHLVVLQSAAYSDTLLQNAVRGTLSLRGVAVDD